MRAEKTPERYLQRLDRCEPASAPDCRLRQNGATRSLQTERLCFVLTNSSQPLYIKTTIRLFLFPLYELWVSVPLCFSLVEGGIRGSAGGLQTQRHEGTEFTEREYSRTDP